MYVRALAVVGLSLLATAGPAAAAGRCGEPTQRAWCDTAKGPDARAGLLLEALTRDEKISLLAGDELSGVLGRAGTHTGTSNGVERVGLPPIFFSDGPVGPRQGMSTAMPSPMTLASTFDPAIAGRHAAVIADEVKKKGNDVVYAPAINLMRTPLNGRTFEYFGEDPFLTGRLAVGWTRGMQAEGVIANVKHYAANNQEGYAPVTVPGLPLGASTIGNRLFVDVRVDERTLREMYLPGFEAAVKEGNVGTVMCSYPRVNGQFACENQYLLEEVLKRDWGFKGFVLTDYGAAKNTISSLNNGLDLDIWPTVAYQPPLVNAAIAAGLATETTVDEHVRRILRTLFAYGFFDRDAYVDDDTKIDKAAHHAIAGEIEEQGIVMLRNEGPLLPLDQSTIKTLALIGPEIDVLKNGGGSSAITPFMTTSVQGALQARLGAGRVVIDPGSDPAAAAAVAKAADVAVIVVGDRMTEGNDKACMGINCSSLDGIDRDALIEAVTAAQPKTVVVLQTGGPVLTPWRDRTAALLEAWYPGQNGGTAVARVLLGDAEPGGRLPATFPLREEDEPTAGDPEKYPGVAEVRYKEGVLVGYRWFDERKLGVAFPFGFGLTYTTFAFGDLRLESTSGSEVVVSAEVKNAGTRTGTTVPQLYVGMPSPRSGIVQPPWQLKGFDRVLLGPGASQRVKFTLDDRSFSYWNAGASDWDIAAGCYRIGVGASSRDLPLRGIVGRGAECEGALQLPRTATSCTSRRTVDIRLPKRARTARVTYSGRTAKVRRVGGRLRARINFRGLKRSPVRIRITGRTRGGKIVRQTRVYRLCK